MGKTNEQIGTAWKPLCAFSSSPQGERIPTLKIVTLGQTYVTLDGLEIVWHATSAREPLFYLLSFPEGRSKDNVALALWPDEENENAASSNRFRVALHRLRRALGKTEAVFKEYERYRLSPELLATSDVSAMQSALHDAQSLKENVEHETVLVHRPPAGKRPHGRCSTQEEPVSNASHSRTHLILSANSKFAVFVCG
jgi:two-component SAPR family response regulator